MSNEQNIIVRGAREHNLKNISLSFPRDQLVVFTGVSGSGKSSLAFDTIYAEGQRRYVESLSSYARQFLGQMEKPKVDNISGLSPAISIEQKSTSKNPRSTVGTITEIYDYLRVLYARVGVQHCHQCGRRVGSQGIEEMVDRVLQLPESAKFMVLAPRVRDRKGEYKDIFDEAKQEGFVRVRVDGKVFEIEEDIRLDKRLKHTIEIVVDRLIMRADIRSRLTESIETAARIGEGTVIIAVVDGGEILLSRHNSCTHCGISFEEPAPQSFSFNHPQGSCPHCDGLGRRLEFDPELVIPNEHLSIREGAISIWKNAFNDDDRHWANNIRQQLEALSRAHGFSLDDPWSKLTKKVRRIILQGDRTATSGRRAEYKGVLRQLEHWWANSFSEGFRQWCMENFMRDNPCPECEGSRLKPESRAVRFQSKTIHEVVRMSIAESYEFFEGVHLEGREAVIAGDVLREIRSRLKFLLDVGLYYLNMERAAPSLSGGEAQRIRLASQIGSGLVGVLYVLDEPSIGLHQRDNTKLISTLENLRNLGNSVLVVEHDENTMHAADYIVDFGPGAGLQGGEVIAAGTPQEVMACKESLTGRYLRGELFIETPKTRRKGTGKSVRVVGAKQNNLRNLTVEFPLGQFVCVTGVSGSGKSSLVNETLYKGLAQKINKAHVTAGAHDRIEGIESLDKVINIDQDPIGRTPRSNPATYSKLFDPIRRLFAQTPEAKVRGYQPGRFSFNVPGGRCDACEGDGVKKIEMHFLADVYVTCETCKGRRFNRETLQVRYHGKNIAEVLDMTVAEAREIFANIPMISRILETLSDVGLDYIKLGQPAPTLSGGEAQRVKLARELGRAATGSTLYILDEPTTGLHFADVQKLLNVLNRLADRGNTVIVIEHNLDVIKCADWVIDLGPEGGSGGGLVVAQGTPEEVARCKSSFTGEFLAPIVNGAAARRKKIA